MRRLSLGSPVGNFEQWATNAIKTIELASYEDTEGVVDDFSVSGEYTKSRALDASASGVTIPTIAWDGAIYPTADDATAINAAIEALRDENAALRAVLATLIEDIKQRGQKRSY